MISVVRFIPRLAAVFLVSVALAGCVERPDYLAEARGLVSSAEAGMTELSGLTDPAQAQAKTLEIEKQLNEAVVLYVSANADQSDDADVLREFADLAERAGSYDLSGKAFERLAGLPDGTVPDYLRAGLNYEQTGEYGAMSAARVYEAALNADPEPAMEALAYARLIRIALRTGDLEAAEKRLTKARLAGVEHPELGVAQALWHVRQGRMALAAESLGVATGQAPDQISDYVRDLTAILRAFEQSGGRIPESVNDLRGYASLMVRIGRVDAAIPALERALALAPEDVVTLNMLGSIRMQTGDVDAARALFERSLAAEPEQPRTRQALEALNAQQ